MQAARVTGTGRVDHLTVFVDARVLDVLGVEAAHVEKLELARLEHVFLLRLEVPLRIHSFV